METEKKAHWSDLPPELWPVIGNRLDNRVDALRFRSVCKLWRSSVPLFQQHLAPPLPIGFSPPSKARVSGRQPQAFLFQTTIYRMESIIAGDEPNSLEPWLLKLEESNSGPMRIVDPISNKPLRYFSIDSSKEFNLLDFRVVELRKSYTLSTFRNYRKVTTTYVNKVVAMGPTHLDGCAILRIDSKGNLGFLRLGDKKWTYVDGQNSQYDDLIIYKGQCYVVDKLGTVSWVNSEFKAIQFSPTLYGFGGQKHLIECCGDLYVVDRYLEMEGMLGHHVDEPQAPRNARYMAGDGEAIDFKVYKLDQEWGRWEEVKNLGDQVFVLSNDGSFSVSSTDFVGVKGNCIFFTNLKLRDVVKRRSYNRVFDLEDGSIRALAALPGYSRMLSPPAAWLSPN